MTSPDLAPRREARHGPRQLQSCSVRRIHPDRCELCTHALPSFFSIERACGVPRTAVRSSSQSSAASPQTWPGGCTRPARASAATRFGSDWSSRRRPPSARGGSSTRCRVCAVEPRASRDQAAPWRPAPRGPTAARCAACWRQKRTSRTPHAAGRSATMPASSRLDQAPSRGPAAQANRGRRLALRGGAG